MKHLELYEQLENRNVVLKSRQERTIKFKVMDGKISNIVNNSGVRFPFDEGEYYNMTIEIWCCNNGFTMNGKDMCPEPKIFGVRVKDVPQGHEWRSIWPGKFKKR